MSQNDNGFNSLDDHLFLIYTYRSMLNGFLIWILISLIFHGLVFSSPLFFDIEKDQSQIEMEILNPEEIDQNGNSKKDSEGDGKGSVNNGSYSNKDEHFASFDDNGDMPCEEENSYIGIGISYEKLPNDPTEVMVVRHGSNYYFKVDQVMKNGPADKAGLKHGDLVKIPDVKWITKNFSGTTFQIHSLISGEEKLIEVVSTRICFTRK